MDGFEILHGEFSLEDRYGLLQKCCTSTQSNKYTISESHRKTNKEVSDLTSTNPKEVMYVVNRLY
jgi:hypothetical protein